MKTNVLTGTPTPLTSPYRRMRWQAGLALLLALVADVALAQSFTNFSSRSTGADGDLIVAANVTTNIAMQSHPDGIFHYRTITINSGATVTFTPNALNTPVYLLAWSNVLINGTIDVQGKPGGVIFPGVGGPGGFRGGYGAKAATPAIPSGAGKGPSGGAKSGSVFGSAGTFTYGNALCTPLVGGSGGGGSEIQTGQGGGGGGGGGAILIACDNWIMNNGTVQALGGGGGAGGGQSIGGSGSGGAIRLVAPLVTGNGKLNVTGGGAGRIRIDSDISHKDAAFSIQMLPNPAASATIGSQGFVFPEPNFLTITNVTIGSQSWVLHPTNSIFIPLAAGPAVSALVQIVASGSFYSNSIVPIAVVVTPDQGATTYYTNVVNISNNAGSTNVTVTIPTGTTSTLHVWTR